MRLCRFRLDDEVTLSGFYLDKHVVPIDQAVEAFVEAMELELLLTETDDLLRLLPPRGECTAAARELFRWITALDHATLAELSIPIEEVQLLRPIERPGKIVMLARNYPDHIVEQGDLALERSETFPYVFLKPPTALNNPGGPIVIPSISPSQIDWECELGVVIGSRCRHVSEADALRHVAGYTVVNDVTDRAFKPNPGRKKRERDAFFDWQHGKWHDTFCPVGPCVLAAGPGVDPQGFSIKLSVNGQLKQNATTAQMIFPVAAIVAFVSSLMTLEPGDLIATGTPAGVGKARGEFLRPDDVVIAEIAGIGRLENPVVAEESA